MTCDVSVVVPLLNEAENIPELYARLTAVLAQIRRSYELVFVDDGSSDDTFQVLCTLQERDPRVHLLRLRRNFGKTAALKAGFDFAAGDVIVAMDGDLQHLPEEVPRLLDAIDAGYDIANGWRARRVDHPLLRRFPSWIANRLMAWLSGVDLHDFGGTFKAYRREIIKNTEIYGELHRFIPALASWQGVRIIEVPITNGIRRHGTSKFGLSRTTRVIFDLITVKFLMDYLERPLHFFGGCGLILGGSGGVLLAVLAGLKLAGEISVHEYLGTILFGMLLVIVGIQLLAIGLATEVSTRIYHAVGNHPIYVIRELRSRRRVRGGMPSLDAHGRLARGVTGNDRRVIALRHRLKDTS